MSKVIELPDDVYDLLQAAADARKLSVAEWIALRVGEPEPWVPPTFPPPEEGGPRTAYDQLKKYIGRLRSPVQRNAAVDAGSEAYADDLEQKKREGRL